MGRVQGPSALPAAQLLRSDLVELRRCGTLRRRLAATIINYFNVFV